MDEYWRRELAGKGLNVLRGAGIGNIEGGSAVATDLREVTVRGHSVGDIGRG